MSGIKAEVIADSVNDNGVRITSFSLEYPRFIHAELMTHRMFSRNGASSRAIPIMKKIKHVWKNPAIPVHFGKNKSGMQAKQELTGFRYKLAKFLWLFSSKVACVLAYGFHKIGLHKQIACRILEPFEMYKVIVTATEFNNWFWLRDHEDAQPEIRELAQCMRGALDLSEPVLLWEGCWHTPYYADGSWKPSPSNGNVDIQGYTLQEALKISASCCAQVSYRELNNSLEKASRIFSLLIESTPCHASPTEHQATPIDTFEQEGVTHKDKNGDFWSGNFKDWVQYRQIIPNNCLRG